MSDERKIKDNLDPKVWLDGAPLTRDSINGHDAELVATWRVKWNGYTIAAERYPFYTDFASIPAVVRFLFARIFPARSIYDFAALAHDIGYRNGFVRIVKGSVSAVIPVDQEQIDEMFFDLMVDLINTIKPNRVMRAYYIARAKLMFQMVSWFGGGTWRGYRDRDRKALEKRVSQEMVDSARERANRE